MSKLTRIEYRSHMAAGSDGPWRVYLFYPDGVWDEDKKTLEEAQKAYPKSRYQWVKIKSD